MAVASPFAAFEAAVPAIINENPRTIVRTRRTLTDTLAPPAVYTAGPYTIRLERTSGGGETTIYNELGSTTVFMFDGLGYNLPKTVVEGGETVPLFRTGDIITDEDGREMRITSPQIIQGKVVQFIAEYRG